MTKAELMNLVGRKVTIYFKGREAMIYGTLGYADEFSAKHDYRKPGCFYVANTSFKVSHVRRVIEFESEFERIWQNAVEGMKKRKLEDVGDW